ncbi:uncharacterized protein LOC132743242 [Ruditapes philippinarum]|uniref:uncharacterized protein LOC132743242 n=1 Tax=Ruditapes philippinarum TaxID=129788 RepID=UPI00295AD7BC|nr:uncharacterized protein LOC132743242 [Ruditapes philippinarum]
MSSRNKKPLNYKLLSTVGTTDSGDEFEQDARVLPLYASPGKIGESISDENVSSKSDEGEDDEMAFMMKQIQELDAEEKRLLQERKKDELRMQLEEKQRRVRSLKKEIRCGIIVGDSIVKHLPLIEGVQLSAFPGTTITRLQHQLSTINLSAFSFIIVHVGTNNVAKGHSVAFMCSAFADLVNYLRARAPGIRIIISSVLPRPVDDDSSRSIIYELNAYLEKNMAKDLNFHFLKSYRPFCFKGQIKRHLIARLDGGLHLNSEGGAPRHAFA